MSKNSLIIFAALGIGVVLFLNYLGSKAPVDTELPPPAVLKNVRSNNHAPNAAAASAGSNDAATSSPQTQIQSGSFTAEQLRRTMGAPEDSRQDSGLDNLEHLIQQNAIGAFLKAVGLSIPAAQKSIDYDFGKEFLNRAPVATLDISLGNETSMKVFVSKTRSLEDLSKPLEQRMTEVGLKFGKPQKSSIDGSAGGKIVAFSSAERTGYMLSFSALSLRAHYVITVETDLNRASALSSLIQGIRADSRASTPF